jgi:transposase
MSLKTPFPVEVPEATRELVEPLLPEGSVYRLVGQQANRFLSDEHLAVMYADEGRPAVNPVVLVLVVVFQFMEKLPDRAAATVIRLEWKYALRQELTWQG